MPLRVCCAANPRRCLCCACLAEKFPMCAGARVIGRSDRMNVQPFSAETPATQATMRVSAATHPQRHLQQRNRKEEGGEGEKRPAVGGVSATAKAMPQTAAWVAELRLLLGAERVDRALAASQRARRHHAALAASHGPARADAWLKAQSWPHGRFWASEGGSEVGVRLEARA